LSPGVSLVILVDRLLKRLMFAKDFFAAKDFPFCYLLAVAASLSVVAVAVDVYKLCMLHFGFDRNDALSVYFETLFLLGT